MALSRSTNKQVRLKSNFVFWSLLILGSLSGNVLIFDATARCPNGTYKNTIGECVSIISPNGFTATSTPSMLDFESMNKSTILNSTIPVHMLTYQNGILGLKINYPSDWIVKEHRYSELNTINRVVDFTTRENNSEPTEEGAFVLIDAEDISGKNLALKDYIRDKFDTDIILSKMYRIGDTLGNINGRPAWQVEWQNPNCCKSGDEHGLEVFILVGDKAYEIAYYGGPNYLNHFPEFLKMIYSLKIK